jgi:hypothetical protein
MIQRRAAKRRPRKDPMTPKSTPPSPARVPTAVGFRQAIAQAETDGIDKTDMTLRVTFRDESELKRDPSVRIDEISFLGGEMRFLGVKVVSGGITTSTLDRGAS